MADLNEFIFQAVSIMRSHAGDAGARELDFLSREILYRIGEAHLSNEALIVGDIISDDNYGSPLYDF